jgi:outer membrane lipoprotein-sorting protein
LLVALAPPDLRGLAVLQHSHRDRPSEQWIYQPLWGRKREVSAGTKSKSFVGSDFTIQDLEIIADAADWTEEEVHAELLGEESVDGRSFHLIELRPGSKSFGYASIRLSLEKTDLLPERIEMLDATGRVEKILKLEDFEAVGGIPTPRRLEMKRVGRPGGTLIELSEIRYDQGFPESMFETRSIERGVTLEE